ncbi:MAG: SusC/RagA family TonB-linked outer membrane protein [Prolixibacteraceae bacterium]
MKRIYLLLAIFAIGLQSALGQTREITGTVTSAEDGSTIPGVSVSVKGTSLGTITDINGKFFLKAPQNAGTLVFSFVGMQTLEAAISGNVMNVVMKSDVVGINEVVVTAMGIAREKKSIGYSATTVGSEEISNAKTINPMAALSGKVAGVDISSSQTPGGTQNIAIRGFSSFGNNQPLYVIDGVVITNSQSRTGTNGLNSQADFGSGINALNPNDIENITVLKGSAASSMYGSRAAQGVIMITTKAGKNTDGKIKIDYDGGVTTQRIGRLPFEQTMFGQGWSGDRALDENGSWGAIFDGKERPWGNIVGDEQLMIPNTYKKDRVRDFYDFGLGFNNAISFTGGTEKSTFRASVSQTHEDGPIPTNDDSYRRYTIGINASQKATSNFKVTTSLNFSTEKNEVAPTGQDNSIYRSVNEISTGLSIVDLKDLNSKFNGLDYYFTPYGLNPYQVLAMREAEQNKQKFFGKLELEYTILENLKLTYRFGGDYESGIIRQHFDAVKFTKGAPNYGSSTESPGSYSERRTERVQINHDLMLNFNQRFGEDFSLNAVLGLNTNERSMSRLEGEIKSIYIPGFYHLSNSLTPATSTQLSSKNRLWGAYVSTDLGYRDYAYLTLTARNDHSSTLPENNNSYFYPSAMLSFILSDYLKGKDVDMGALNFAKVRMSYGRTGKDADPYAVYNELEAASLLNPGYPEIDDLIFPLGGVSSFTLANSAGNPNLKPELTDEFEIGAELSFFQSRLGLDVTYYNKLTKGLIAIKPMDPSAGYTRFLQANIGDVRNSGIELLFSATPLKSKSFAWDIDYNFTKNVNKVEKLEVPEIFLGGYGGIGIYAVEGEALGQFKAQKVLKVDIDGKEYTVVDGTGNPQPTPNEEYLDKDINEKFRMGITNTFTYKRLSLSATVDYRYGGYIYSYTKDYMHWVGSGPETVYNSRNPFIVPNSVVANADGTYRENITPVDPTALHTFYSNGGFQYADFSIIDRSYVKLRNVSLAYDLPSGLCKKLRIERIRASVTAENILLWTPVENQYIDPEVTTFGNNIEAKFGEFATTPPYQTYVFGLSVSF